ncbi:MAG: ATP-dependent Clp protease ATP-binding subunit [Nanoarchaeota archaeon]|nr:ATP-dependent Clp protease ATP-binding subunit [Nanoarchaeota archaeon]
MRIHANDANIMERLYFRDTRFGLSSPEEFLVRLFSYVFYSVLSVLAVFSILSGIPRLFFLGIFFALFLGDRFLHIWRGEDSILRALHRKDGASLNVARFLSPASLRAVSSAFRYAKATGQDFTFALFSELSGRKDVRRAFYRLGVSREEFLAEISAHSSETSGDRNALGDAGFLEGVRVAVSSAFVIAADAREDYIQPLFLFAGIFSSSSAVFERTLRKFRLSVSDVHDAVFMERRARESSGISRSFSLLGGYAGAHPRMRRSPSVNRALTSRPTPTLDQFSEDVTALVRARGGGLLVGHEKEYAQLLDALTRPGKPNAILVGEPGVGKTALLHHLAYRMTRDEVPPFLFDRRILSLSISRILADASPEELAGRLTKISDEIMIAGNVLVFVPDIHELFKPFGKGGVSAIDVLLPIVRSGSIPLLGDTYPREFKALVEPRSDFVEQFEIIRVEEMSAAEAIRFLTYAALPLEKQFGVFVTIPAIRRIVEIADRHIVSKPLPTSALDLLKEALARASREKAQILSPEAATRVAEEEVGLPLGIAGEAEAEKLLHLEDTIHKRLVNQSEAVSAVSRALREYRSGLSRTGGPIAVFLFVGPTGVGKTELSKILAEAQFGSRDAMRRFDMSEYQDRQSIFRLIGTPDGATTGGLTDTIREHPYSLILLDEFEKAHPDVLNLFLQVFDDGRLTDSLGRTVQFENTIVIATSNAHSDFVKTEIEKGRSAGEIADALKGKLTTYFKPELLNRFSDIIVFRDLNQQEIFQIAQILLRELTDQVRSSNGIDLKCEESAIREIARRGYSNVFGARPLRKVISEEARGRLAEMILRGEVSAGDSVIFSFDGKEFVFGK